MQITLAAFERIESLFNACLKRPALDKVMQHPMASRSYITDVYFRPEWKLLDACVEATSLDYTDGFASAVDAAAAILTGALIGTVEIVDEMDAA